MGWRDMVSVAPLHSVRVIMRFEDYTGRFPYHCHILEHEDHDMMRQVRARAWSSPAAHHPPPITRRLSLAAHHQTLRMQAHRRACKCAAN